MSQIEVPTREVLAEIGDCVGTFLNQSTDVSSLSDLERLSGSLVDSVTNTAHI
jgi:hypothetical protein